jgi:hypothetical protein
MCVERGVCCNSEEGVCTLFSVLHFCVVQGLNFVIHLISFKSILVIFYEIFSLNIQMICSIFIIRADVGTFIFIVAFWL